MAGPPRLDHRGRTTEAGPSGRDDRGMTIDMSGPSAVVAKWIGWIPVPNLITLRNLVPRSVETEAEEREGGGTDVT